MQHCHLQSCSVVTAIDKLRPHPMAVHTDSHAEYVVAGARPMPFEEPMRNDRVSVAVGNLLTPSGVSRTTS